MARCMCIGKEYKITRFTGKSGHEGLEASDVVHATKSHCKLARRIHTYFLAHYSFIETCQSCTGRGPDPYPWASMA
jgi:hypothetical protein